MISKVQKEYLENRLKKIRNEKIEERFPDYSSRLTDEEIYEAFVTGDYTLKSLGDVKSNCYGSITEKWFNFPMLRERKDAQTKEYNQFLRKLDDTIYSILDKVILGDMAIEAAISELEEF